MPVKHSEASRRPKRFLGFPEYYVSDFDMKLGVDMPLQIV